MNVMRTTDKNLQIFNIKINCASFFRLNLFDNYNIAIIPR